MKSEAFVSLLVTFVLSIPVATQQPQPQKPGTPETEAEQDSVVRITTNLVQVDAVVTKLFHEGALVYGTAAKLIDVTGQTDFERITVAGGLRLTSLGPGTYVLQVTVKDYKAKRADANQLVDFEVIP